MRGVSISTLLLMLLTLSWNYGAFVRAEGEPEVPDDDTPPQRQHGKEGDEIEQEEIEALEEEAAEAEQNMANKDELEEGGAFDRWGEDEMGPLSNGNWNQVFKKMDANGDGKATFDEVMTATMEMRKETMQSDIKAYIAEYDQNGDYVLSKEEVLGAKGPTPHENPEEAKRRELEQKKFDLADANQNGVLEESEMAAMFHPGANSEILQLEAKESLESKDRNKDGQLTLHEFWGTGRGGHDGGAVLLSDADRKDFEKLDTNKDGVLSAKELEPWESGEYHYKEAMREMFEVADKNHDNTVSLAELQAAKDELAETDAHEHLAEWLDLMGATEL